MGACCSKRTEDDEIVADVMKPHWPDDEAGEGQTRAFVLPDYEIRDGKLALDLSFMRLVQLPGEVCDKKGTGALILNGNNITNFPYEIAKLRKLRELHLANNYLEFLPAQVCTLVQLEVLDLSYNSIHALPYCVGHLTSLRHVDIGYNNIRDLPTSLRYCEYLSTLILEGNSLEVIPEVVCSLDSLETLVLSDNEIHDLPEGLLKLRTLRELYLDDNKLEVLPKVLCDFLAAIDVLDVSRNPGNLTIEKTEEATSAKEKKNRVQPQGRHHQLIPYKQGHPIPPSPPVDQSQVFSEINLNEPDSGDIFEGEQYYEGVESVDAQPGALRRFQTRAQQTRARARERLRPSPKWGILLRELHKAGFLPKINVKLPTIKRPLRQPRPKYRPSQYTWRGWRINTERALEPKAEPRLPSSVGTRLDPFGHPVDAARYFPAVQKIDVALSLNLSLQDYADLPPELCQMVNLNILKLDHNTIAELPEEIGNLEKLTVLHYNSNELCRVPESLQSLTSLRGLYLRDNQLRYLPEWFGGFASLTYLSLENNSFLGIPGEICCLESLEVLLLGGNRISQVS